MKANEGLARDGMVLLLCYPVGHQSTTSDSFCSRLGCFQVGHSR